MAHKKLKKSGSVDWGMNSLNRIPNSLSSCQSFFVSSSFRAFVIIFFFWFLSVYIRVYPCPNKNRKNGKSIKTMKSSVGEFELDVPRDRNGSYEPQIVKKHQTHMCQACQGFHKRVIVEI